MSTTQERAEYRCHVTYSHSCLKTGSPLKKKKGVLLNPRGFSYLVITSGPGLCFIEIRLGLNVKASYFKSLQNFNRPKSAYLDFFLRRIKVVSERSCPVRARWSCYPPPPWILSGLFNGLLINQLCFGEGIFNLSLAANLSCVSDISGHLCTVIWVNKRVSLVCGRSYGGY